MVQLHRAAGDGQAQAEAVGAGVGAALEGFEDAPQAALVDARAVVADAHHQAFAALHQARAHAHLGARRGVAHGVADDVLEGPVEQFLVGAAEERLLGYKAHLAALARRFEAGVLDDLRQQLDDVQQAVFAAVLARLGPRQGEQLLDQLVHAPRLALDALQHAGLPRRLPQQADGGAHPRQRRTQLVGDVVQQVLLRLHQRLELPGHAVAVLGQVDDLVAAPPQARLDAHLEAALGDLAHGLAQPDQRPRQVLAEQQGEERAHQHAGEQRAQAARRRRLVEGGGGRGAQQQAMAVLAGDRLLEAHLGHGAPGQ